MKKLKFLFLTLSYLAMSFSYSQQGNSVVESPYIEVTGTAEKEIIPDEIFIAITIRERVENKVKITIEDQENKLKTAVKQLGIDLSNLVLADADANYVKVKWQTKDVITQKDYVLQVGDANTVGLVFQELEKIQITDAYISKVSHSKIEELKKEVRIMAIKAAKEKADYLLEAINEKTGNAIIVRENDIYPTFTANSVSNYRKEKYNVGTFSDLISESKNEIQFQKIIINSSIYVKFLIQH
jgi:uncharacterized protein